MEIPPKSFKNSAEEIFSNEPSSLETTPIAVENAQDGATLQKAQRKPEKIDLRKKPPNSFSARLIEHFTHLFNISPTEWLLRPPAIVQFKSAKECKQHKREFITQAQEKGLEYRSYRLQGDGRTLDAMALHAKDGADKDWVLFIPGLHENYESSLNQALELAQDHNVNVLLFNYRGVQESSGEIHSFNDMVDDANLAATCIAETLIEGSGTLSEKKDKIILKGHSLGGAVAGKVAATNPHIHKVFLDRTFNSYKESVDAYYKHNIKPHVPFLLQPLTNRIKNYAIKTLEEVSFTLVETASYVAINDESDVMILADHQFSDKMTLNDQQVKKIAQQLSIFTTQEIQTEPLIKPLIELVTVLKYFKDYKPTEKYLEIAEDIGQVGQLPSWYQQAEEIITALEACIANPNEHLSDLDAINEELSEWIELLMEGVDLIPAGDLEWHEAPQNTSTLAEILSHLAEKELIASYSENASSLGLSPNVNGLASLAKQCKILMGKSIARRDTIKATYLPNSNAHTAPLAKEIFTKVLSELGKALPPDPSAFSTEQ